MNNISNKIWASMLVTALIAVTGVVTTVSMARAQGDIDWAEFSRAAGEAYGKALAGLGVSSPTTPDGAFGGTVELTETQFAAGIKIGDASSYTFPTTAGSANGGKLLSLNSAGTALTFSSLAVAGVNNLFATNTPDILISTNTGADAARYRMVLGGTATTVHNAQFEVIGDTQLDYASSTYLTVDGPVHFNDTSAGTADVRIEGDNITDLFFADVSVDRVGIGTTTPRYLLDVDGSFNVGVQGANATSENQFYVRAGINGSIVGINGTTSPFGYLAVEHDNRYQTMTVGSSTATIFEIEADGTVKINDEGTSYIDFIVEGDTQANLLMVDASADRVGIATSTPFAVLAVHALAGQNAFLVGSTTNELFKIDASGAVSFNGGGWPLADFTVQGDTQTQLFFVDASVDRVNITGSLHQESGLSTASSTFATTTVTALTQGGGVYSTTVRDTAVTLMATELQSYGVLNFGAHANQNSTITFPSSSTLSALIPNAGDRRSWILTNDTSTATVYLTFADGTGIDLRTSTSTPNSLILPARDSALLTCWRRPHSGSPLDIACFFDAFE